MLPRKTPLRRKTRLKPRSAKLSERMKEYMKLRNAFLKEQGFCAAAPLIWPDDLFHPLATDVHHRGGRGENLLNVSTWIAVCRKAHRWIHDHPREARALGLLQT